MRLPLAFKFAAKVILFLFQQLSGSKSNAQPPIDSSQPTSSMGMTSEVGRLEPYNQLSESMSFQRRIVGWLESMLSERIPKKFFSLKTKIVFSRFLYKLFDYGQNNNPLGRRRN
jgi:hypothetical protein